MRTPFKIAVIPGDGIGREVMPEGLRALDAAAARFDIPIRYTHIEWASCDYYAQTGQMMPDDWKTQLQGMDAIYFGAVGWPATVPDHVSLWGSLLKFRREFDQYINLRPAKTLPGVTSPLAGRGPGDIGQGRRPARAAYDAIVAAIEHVLAHGPHTRDLGGTASTTEMGQAIAAHIAGSRS